MKVYVDTEVYIDVLEGRPRAALAYAFFARGWNCAFEIVVSDWVKSELKRRKLDAEFPLLFNQFKSKNKLHFVEHTQEELALAKSKSEHWQDHLHYLLAKKSGCNKIATYDDEFISSFSPIFDITYPENI